MAQDKQQDQGTADERAEAKHAEQMAKDAQTLYAQVKQPAPGTQPVAPQTWAHLLGQPVTPKYTTHPHYGEEGFVTKASAAPDSKLCVLNIRMPSGVKLVEQPSALWKTGPSTGKASLSLDEVNAYEQGEPNPYLSPEYGERLQVAEEMSSLDKLLRSLKPDLPEHYGTTVDGVRAVVEHLMGKPAHVLIEEAQGIEELGNIQQPTAEVFRDYVTRLQKNLRTVMECYDSAGANRHKGQAALNVVANGLQMLSYKISEQWDTYIKEGASLNEQIEALRTIEAQVEFVEKAAIQCMPFAMQLSTSVKPTLAGQPPQAQLDFGRAALIAVQSARALWAANQAINTGTPLEAPGEVNGSKPN